MLARPNVELYQAGRLVDILLFGPLLVYLGSTLQLAAPFRIALVAGGVATILSNIRNRELVSRVQAGEPAGILLGMGGCY